MKILLINPPIREWAKPNCIPSGLGYLASVLMQDGYEVEVLDINGHRYSREEVQDRIEKSDADVFGVGGMITVYGYIKWLTQVIKQYHPDRTIIGGGSSASSIPRIFLERTQADIAVIGEAEVTLPELIHALQNGGDLKSIPGIWHKDGNGKIDANPPRPAIKNLDTIPFPAWDLFPMDVYLHNPVGAPNIGKWENGKPSSDTPLTMNVLTSRGCPYQCIYCYHDFMGMKYRHRSPQNILDEIVYLVDRYGVDYIHFTDDDFVINRKHVIAFSSLLLESGVNIQWGSTGRVNLMSEELLAKMAEAGCVWIGYGIESGSQKMLDTMKKQVTIEQAKKTIELTRKYIDQIDCSFMVGTPGETRETIMETVEFCKELDLSPEVIFFATPYPGTELYDIARRRGLIKDEEAFILSLWEQGEKITVNFSELSDNELHHMRDWAIEELKARNIARHSEDERVQDQ
jgi:radical SAM superfamily enzyme YgiQ (UPF0313 family)